MPPDADAGAPAPTGNDNGNGDAPNPNDLATDLSIEEERALVDASFGEPGGALWGDDKKDGKDANNVSNTDGKQPGDGGTGTDSNKQPGDVNDGAADKGTGSTTGANADDKTPTGTTGEATTETPATPTTEETQQTTETEAPQAVDTSDLFVELTDANGKEFKIGVNDPIPDDLVFLNDAQLAELTEARLEMKGVLRDRQTEFEQAQQTAQTQAQEAQAQAAADAEIQALITGGLLDAPAKGPADGKKYTPEEVKADPALQKIVDIFSLKNEKNLPTFSLAHALYEKQQRDESARQEQEQQNDAAKKRSALIGGSSSSSSGGGGNLYQQGSAGTIHDLDFSDL